MEAPIELYKTRTSPLLGFCFGEEGMEVTSEGSGGVLDSEGLDF